MVGAKLGFKEVYGVFVGVEDYLNIQDLEFYITLRDLFNYIYFETQKVRNGEQNPVMIGTLANDMVLKVLNPQTTT